MGLGNQMFQYAAARALSLELNQPLKLDISSYKGYALRQFELDKYFHLQPQVATETDIKHFNLSHPVRRTWNKLFPGKKIRSLPYEETKAVRTLYEAVYLLRPPHKQAVYEERHFHFDKNFFKAPDDVYLKGYWMSPKYFMGHEDVIKQEFTIQEAVTAPLASLASEMNNCNSLAVHIRCTDKMDSHNLKLYGEIPARYFEKAINYITERKGPVHVYIFSDDIETAKQYMPAGIQCTYVSKYITKKAIDDFYLITQCKNVVMPNSTFSWWAAYLNNHEDKIVVVPGRWYNEAPYNYQDIYYPGWVKMDF